MRVENKDPETLSEAHEVAKQLRDKFRRYRNMRMFPSTGDKQQ